MRIKVYPTKGEPYIIELPSPIPHIDEWIKENLKFIAFYEIEEDKTI